MIAYLDSSVVLRVLLGQRGRLKEWKSVREGVASALVEVECLRTLDRLRLREALEYREFALRREAVFRLMQEIELVEPTRSVLTRASQPFPTELGTLDAIHLGSALSLGGDLGAVCAYDARLAGAASSKAIQVLAPS